MEGAGPVSLLEGRNGPSSLWHARSRCGKRASIRHSETLDDESVLNNSLNIGRSYKSFRDLC